MSVNTQNIIREMDWLQQLIAVRLRQGNSSITGNSDSSIPEPPELILENSAYAHFVQNEALTASDRLLLALSLAPHVKPELLDNFLAGKTNSGGRPLSEAGGLVGIQYRGFIPTGMTYLFLGAKYDLSRRLKLLKELKNNVLIKKGIIKFSLEAKIDPIHSGAIILNRDYLDQLIEI